MKLDRSTNKDGHGKYALVKVRKIDEIFSRGTAEQCAKVNDALAVLATLGILDPGNTPETEFFVIRLKDEFSRPALLAYADAADGGGEGEYACEVLEMAARSGPAHPFCKKPD